MIVHLRAGTVSLVLDARGGGLPVVVHWGAPLGELSEEDLTALADAAVPPTAVEHARTCRCRSRCCPRPPAATRAGRACAAAGPAGPG